MAIMIYPSALMFIQQRLFDVYVPAFYQPNLPEEFLNTEPFRREKANPHKRVAINALHPTPFITPDDPDQLSVAAFCLETLFDMHLKRIGFEFVNEDDIVEMFDGVDRYLLSLKPCIETNDSAAIEYAKIVLDFRKELYKLYFRYMKTHPAALEGLYPERNKDTNLMSLMAIVSGPNVPKAYDPLQAKRHPPIKLTEDGEPKPETKIEIEVSYGISQDLGHDVDDVSNFNLDGFLGRN